MSTMILMTYDFTSSSFSWFSLALLSWYSFVKVFLFPGSDIRIGLEAGEEIAEFDYEYSSNIMVVVCSNAASRLLHEVFVCGQHDIERRQTIPECQETVTH